MSDSVTERLLIARENIDAALLAMQRAHYDDCYSLITKARSVLHEAFVRIPRERSAAASDPARDDPPEKPEHEWRTPPRDFTDHIMDTGV